MAAAYWIVRSSPTMTAELVSDPSQPSSHHHLAASEGTAFRNDPSTKQIEIDVAAAQDQADPFAAEFRLVLQGGGEGCGARAFGEVVGIGPVGADRRRNLVVADLN